MLHNKKLNILKDSKILHRYTLLFYHNIRETCKQMTRCRVIVFLEKSFKFNYVILKIVSFITAM